MIRIFLITTLIACSLSAASQDTVWVKASSGKLQPFERRYLQYTEMKDGKVKLSALLTRKAEKKTYDGKNALLVVQTYQQEKVVDRDSSFVDPATLLPFAYFTEIQSEGHREKVLFLSGGIQNQVIYQDSVTNAVKPDHQSFNGVIGDDIISCLPLKENAVFAFRAVNPGKRYFEYPVAITVEGKEDVDVAGLGKIPCWRVRVGTEKSGTTEWYSVKDQVQVKKKFVFANGNIFYRVMITG